MKRLNLRANGGKTPKTNSWATMPLASAFTPTCNISSALAPLSRKNSLSQHFFIQKSKTSHVTVEFTSQTDQNAKNYSWATMLLASAFTPTYNISSTLAPLSRKNSLSQHFFIQKSKTCHETVEFTGQTDQNTKNYSWATMPLASAFTPTYNISSTLAPLSRNNSLSQHFFIQKSKTCHETVEFTSQTDQNSNNYSWATMPLASAFTVTCNISSALAPLSRKNSLSQHFFLQKSKTCHETVEFTSQWGQNTKNYSWATMPQASAFTPTCDISSALAPLSRKNSLSQHFFIQKSKTSHVTVEFTSQTDQNAKNYSWATMFLASAFTPTYNISSTLAPLSRKNSLSQHIFIQKLKTCHETVEFTSQTDQNTKNYSWATMPLASAFTPTYNISSTLAPLSRNNSLSQHFFIQKSKTCHETVEFTSQTDQNSKNYSWATMPLASTFTPTYNISSTLAPLSRKNSLSQHFFIQKSKTCHETVEFTSQTDQNTKNYSWATMPLASAFTPTCNISSALAPLSRKNSLSQHFFIQKSKTCHETVEFTSQTYQNTNNYSWATMPLASAFTVTCNISSALAPLSRKNSLSQHFFIQKSKTCHETVEFTSQWGQNTKNYSWATMPQASAFTPTCNISSALDPLSRKNSLSQHFFIQKSKTCHETVEFTSQTYQNTNNYSWATMPLASAFTVTCNISSALAPLSRKNSLSQHFFIQKSKTCHETVEFTSQWGQNTKNYSWATMPLASAFTPTSNISSALAPLSRKNSLNQHFFIQKSKTSHVTVEFTSQTDQNAKNYSWATMLLASAFTVTCNISSVLAPLSKKNSLSQQFFIQKSKTCHETVEFTSQWGQNTKNYSWATMPQASAFTPTCNISSALDPLSRKNSLSQHFFIQKSKTCHETVEFTSQTYQNTNNYSWATMPLASAFTVTCNISSVLAPLSKKNSLSQHFFIQKSKT